MNRDLCVGLISIISGILSCYISLYAGVGKFNQYCGVCCVVITFEDFVVPFY